MELRPSGSRKRASGRRVPIAWYSTRRPDRARVEESQSEAASPKMSYRQASDLSKGAAVSGARAYVCVYRSHFPSGSSAGPGT